jgi:phospholipase/carboxylesterase
MLNAIETCTADFPDASILWLHGLGADGSDFAPIVDELALPLAIRFIFPHAPSMPVTVNGGYVMPAWYDIYSQDIAGNQDEAGIRSAQSMLTALIEREKSRGVRPERIVLAGFSQGGAIALQTALRYPNRLAGVITLSTYLPLESSLAKEMSEANRDLPVFMAHGRYDTVIPKQAAEISRNKLKLVGYKVEWHEYPMMHSVCAEEIRDIRRFLLQILG